MVFLPTLAVMTCTRIEALLAQLESESGPRPDAF